MLINLHFFIKIGLKVRKSALYCIIERNKNKNKTEKENEI